MHERYQLDYVFVWKVVWRPSWWCWEGGTSLHLVVSLHAETPRLHPAVAAKARIKDADTGKLVESDIVDSSGKAQAFQCRCSVRAWLQ